MKSLHVIIYVLIIHFIFATHTYAEELVFNKYIALDDKRIDPHEKTRVMLFSSQFSIFPLFNQPAVFIQSPALQGVDPLAGMLGAIIGVSLANKHNESERNLAIEFNDGLSNALKQIDINKEIESNLVKRLEQNTLFNQLTFEPVSNNNELAQAGLLIKIQEPSIITLSTKTYFDAELRSLYIETNSKVWKKNEVRPIYFSEISVSSAYIQESSKTELRKKWIENEGELLKTKIREGIGEVTKLLVNDLMKYNAFDALTQDPTSIEITHANTGKKIKAKLYKVEESPDRLIGRLGAPDSSILTSIPLSNVKLINSH